MASSPVTGLSASVWPLIPNKIYDNISLANPTFFKFYNERKKPFNGGTQYQPLVLYASDTEGGMVDISSTATNLGTTQTQKTEGIVYSPKGTRNPYSLTVQELAQATGPLAKITLKESKTIQATNRHVEIMSSQLFVGDVNNAATEVWGLDELISTGDATPFVGQIDQSADSWWAPKTTTAATVFNSLSQLTKATQDLCDGEDRPDWGVMDEVLFPRLLDLMGQTGINTKVDNTKTTINVAKQEVEYQFVTYWQDRNSTADKLYLLTSKYCEMLFSPLFDFYASGFTVPTGGIFRTGYMMSVWFMAYTNRRRMGGFSSLTLS